AQKTKTQRGPILSRHSIHPQAKAHQSVNDAAFGGFELAPAPRVARHLQIGNHLIEPAGDAERIRILDRHQPVADLVLFVVPAAAVEPSRCVRCERPPRACGVRLQRAEVNDIGQEPERMTASDTMDVLEENQAAAMIAMKRPHVSPLAARSRRARSPCEGTRPTGLPRKSTWIVGPVPSPGGFFNRLLMELSRRFLCSKVRCRFWFIPSQSPQSASETNGQFSP